MDLLMDVKNILFSATAFIPSKNFYFENHTCNATNQCVNVKFDLTVKSELTKKITLFGQCPHCNTVYYHEDFE